ncbi:hypothetical protein VNO77_41703 [Canavalia gladiata]|uniref:LOB domain-containing protein n=1 Tax=Canavalia gladiata TaxID=3824 RepID=A0AAN9K1Z1_CANGL
MSCNGCRALRKGCSEGCSLRHCLEWIENPQAQAHATLFVAKFLGRATLLSFLSSVPINQRSGMFRSLVYEAVGRRVNPVSGAVGLLWTGNWHLCQWGVQKVLEGQGSSLTPHSLQSTKVVVDVNVAQSHQPPITPSQESQITIFPTTTVSQTKLLTLFF